MTSTFQFSLLTYNIHKGFGFQRRHFSLPDIRAALHDLSPDFLLLQEVQGAHQRRAQRVNDWPDVSQCDYLAGDLWPYSVYAKNAVYASGHHGNAILSKMPIARFENINLTPVKRASRSILHAQIRIASLQKTLHLLCVHLGLFHAERRGQFQMVLAQIRDRIPFDEPLIMAGDFNDWQHTFSRPLAELLQVQEAFMYVHGKHARSFPALKPTLCIDRIYFRGLAIQEVTCLNDKVWRTLSDHIPLYASFTLDEAR